MATKYKWDGVTPPPISEEWKQGDGLGRKIEVMFTRFAQRVIHWGSDFVSDRMVDIFDNSMKILQPGARRMFDSILTWAENQEYMPDEFKKMIADVKKEQGEAAILGILITILSIIFTIFGGMFAPVARRMEHFTDVIVRSWIPSPADVMDMERRGLLPPEQLVTYYGRTGIETNMIDKMKELTRAFPTVGELIAGRWRGKISDADFRQYMKWMRYDDKEIELYNALSEQLPPISDILLMLRREAFQDDIAAKYGYEEEYPAAIEEHLAKIGYDPKWGKMYYRAGWTVPSPTMGYEMLHRGLIDRDTLDDLLKIADYPPFWREKLMDVSYSVLTRVDVRRLLQAGLIDEGKAEETYNRMGYSPEDAKLLTEFAILGITQDERDLTKTDVLNLYEEGVIDRGATSANLVKMGYDGEEAETILKLADVNIAKAARTDLINYVKERFIAKQIDEAGARNELTQIGLKSQSVERYVMNWARAQEVDTALPTMADVKRWYLGSYIEEAKARSLLDLHKHTSEHIEIYIREWNDMKAEAINEAQP